MLLRFMLCLGECTLVLRSLLTSATDEFRALDFAPARIMLKARCWAIFKKYDASQQQIVRAEGAAAGAPGQRQLATSGFSAREVGGREPVESTPRGGVPLVAEIRQQMSTRL